MKKILLATVALTLCITAHSQINKGTKFLGGNLNLSASSNDYQSTGLISGSKSATTTFSVSPTAGFFIKENVAIGLSLGYNYSNSKNSSSSSTSNTTNNTISFNPYIRNYINLSDKALLFIQTSVSYAYGFGNNVNTVPGVVSVTDRTETATIRAALVPGINYFLTNKWALETSIGSIAYSFAYKNYIPNTTTSSSSTQTTTTSNFNFNLSMSTINIGVKYFIGKQ